MPDRADQPEPSKPVRTWRPILLWAAGLLLALGLAWFIGAVTVPIWQVRAAVAHTDIDVARLGGPSAAIRKVDLYLRMPDRIAPGKDLTMLIMGRCGSEATPYLIDILRREQNVRLCTMAVYALGEREDARAVEAVLSAMQDSRAGVRASAASVLRNVSGPRAHQALLAATRDQDAYVRYEVIEAIGESKPPDAVDVMITALSDPDMSVRWGAVQFLAEFRDQRALSALEELSRRETDERVIEEIGKAVEQITTSGYQKP